MALNIPQNLSATPIEIPTEVAKSSGSTRVNLVKHHFTWTIKNFSYSLNAVDQPLRSPVFSVGTEHKTQWYLSFQRNYLSTPAYEYFDLYLGFIPGAVLSTKALFELSIVNDKGTNVNVFKSLNAHHFTAYSSPVGWPNFVHKFYLENPLNGWLPNDSLTIFCELTVVGSIASMTEEGAIDDFVLPLPRLHADFVELYEKPKLTDVTIVTRGKEFLAHKVILAARSPYFSLLLEDKEMMARYDDRLYMMDVRDDVINEVLRFIYTGVAFIDKIADDLLVAAHKFELKRLEALCEKFLANNIAVENAADRLVIGDLYDAVYLKKHALQFICRNATEVLETQRYKALHYTHPNLIDQVLRALTATKIDLKILAGAASSNWTRRRHRRDKKKKAAYKVML